MSFVGDIYKGVVDKFQEPIASNAKAIAMAVQPLVMSCFLLYVLFLVYKLYNNKDFIFEEIINAMLLFAVIGTFTYGGSYYYDYVIPFVTGAGDEISASFLGSGSDSSVSIIDKIYDTYEVPLNAIKKFIDTQEGLDYLEWWAKTAPIRACLAISQFIFVVLIVVNLLISKVMVTLLLSVGIVFFCFAIFPSTRNLFTSFVGSSLNYIFLNIMYCLAASLTANIVKSLVLQDGIPNNIDTSASSEDLDKIFSNLAGASTTVLISTVIIVLAIKEVPSLVSGLTGGVSISGFSYSGALNKAVTAGRDVVDAYKGAKGFGRGVASTSKKMAEFAKSTSSGAWNKFRGNGGVKGA